MKTLLVVDDKAGVRQLLREYFAEQGYRVVAVANGREALHEARHSLPDVILLDLMMPELDGYGFLEAYRRTSGPGAGAPVIVITARDEETSAVHGLELGADDYVIKPFRMRELAARVKAVLRRGAPQSQNGRVLKGGGVIVDEAAHSVTVRGKPVNLTPTEYNLLVFLMRSAGQALTRQQIADHLSETGFDGLDRTLNVHIRNLRTKIEADPDQPVHIETVFGVGYRFSIEAGLTDHDR
jgi:DNA-binding response OmpR family regulator